MKRNSLLWLAAPLMNSVFTSTLLAEMPKTIRLKTPVADLLVREGATETVNLLNCRHNAGGGHGGGGGGGGGGHGRPTCKLREGDLSFSAPQRLDQASLVRYRYTLECSRGETAPLSLFAIRTAQQTRILQYYAAGLKSNIFGATGSKVELVLLDEPAVINAELRRRRCTKFTIDEVSVDPMQ